MFRLRSLWSRSTTLTERKAVPYVAPRFRPQLEGFEDRTVPAAPSFGPALAGAAAPAAVTDLLHITGVNLTNFQIVNGVLNAAGTVTGTLAGLPFVANIENFALNLIPDDLTTPNATECSVLHLELAPIHLNLLGLHADTSPICLDITATEGGGLLGDLLCSLAGGDGGLGIPSLPTLGQLDQLIGGLTGILNGLLGGNQGQPGGTGDVCTGETEVLDLVLGPIDLSLLGLNVSLDDCDDGPVEVCLSATASEGLLGSLLSGIAGGSGLNLDLNEITRIVDQASDALADGVLSGREIGQLTSLVNRLGRR